MQLFPTYLIFLSIKLVITEFVEIQGLSVGVLECLDLELRREETSGGTGTRGVSRVVVAVEVS